MSPDFAGLPGQFVELYRAGEPVQNSNRIYIYLIAFFVLLCCLGSGAAYVGTLPPRSRNAENHQLIDAKTPATFNRSYEVIVASMSAVEREEFLQALNKLMTKYGPHTMDPDSTFRQHVNGKAVSVIVSEAREVQ